MKEIIEKENILIEDMIYEIRGVQVMLDSDIAKLYQVETKRINEALKNNPDKFPERFSFRITEKEYAFLKSKFSTSKGGSRKGHTVFTEQGLYMLATILKSKVATEVSIGIMDTFVKMRHYINYNKNFLPHKFMLLEKKVDDNTIRINELFDKFNPKYIVKDYYSLLLDIFNEAKEEIIIIDNYAGKELLNILKEINKRIIIVSKNIDETLKKKYESQYDNITFIHNNAFHDRFTILDRNKLYSCGASFKDLGKKCFAINEFDNREYLSRLLKTLNIWYYSNRKRF